MNTVIMTALCVLSLTLMLTGCVQYKWVKLDAEMNKKLIEMRSAGADRSTPDNVDRSSSENGQKNKKKGFHELQWVEDANEYRRDTLGRQYVQKRLGQRSK